MIYHKEKIITFIYLICFSEFLHAQKAMYLNPDFISQIRFSVTPALYSPLEINSRGASILYSDPAFGGEYAITFSKMLGSGFGLEAGLGIATIPYNYSYDFEPAPGSPLHDGSPVGSSNFFVSPPTSYSEGAIIFPFTLVKIVPLNQKNHLFLNFAAGFKLNIMSGFPYSGSARYSSRMGEDPAIQFLRYEYDSATESYMAYNFKVGLINFNERFNSFHCNIVGQYSPATLVTGTFEFQELGYLSEGTTEVHNTFIGLELAYGLSLGKKIKKQKK